jgi:glycosyltransferase involved in cell wall biosynthesis
VRVFSGPRRVLYVSPNAYLGGAEKACELFLKYHDRKRYLPSIAFLRDGPLVKQFKAYDVDSYLVPTVRLREVHRHSKLIRDLAKSIHGEGISLVHSTMSYGQFFGGRAANMASVPNVWFQHGPVGNMFDKMVSLINTNAILVNSKFTETEQKRITYRKFPIHIVYSGIEVPSLTESEALNLRKRFREKLGFTDENIVFGLVGRLQDWKGQLEFLMAFRKAYRNNPDLRAIVVGSSDLGSRDYESNLKRYISENGLEKKAILTGFLDDSEMAYRSFDVLVHASIRPEPFGLTPLEGMVRGLPVIASPLGGPSETIQDGRSGLLVDPNNIDALSDALTRLSQDSSLRAVLSKGAKEAVERFLAPALLSRIEGIYDQILNPL